MAKLKVKKTYESALGNTAVMEGVLRATPDSQRLFFELDGKRIEASDIIYCADDSARLANLAPLVNKFYWVKATKKLWVYAGSWSCLNPDSIDQTTADGRYLKLAGGTMAGDLNLGTKALRLNGNLALQFPTNTTDSTITVGFNNPFVYMLMNSGKCLFRDIDFKNGLNSIYEYDNYKVGIVITREALATAPNKSGYVVKVHTPEHPAGKFAGFYQSVNSRSNGVFLQVFRALLPVGYVFLETQNGQGTGATRQWLTSRLGTGKWEWYALLRQSGTEGVLHSHGFIAVNQAVPAGGMDFYLAEATIYDLTDHQQEFLQITDGTVRDSVAFAGSYFMRGDTTQIRAADIIYATAKKSYYLGTNADGSFSLYRVATGAIPTSGKKTWNYAPAEDTHTFYSNVVITGDAASQPLQVRSIVGSVGDGNVGELYLQYGANNNIYLGNTGAYWITPDGSNYTGTAANANKVNGHTVNIDIPANALFTDTIYVHPTTDGNKHIPAGGSEGQVLQWRSAGAAEWTNVSNNLITYPDTGILRGNLGDPTVQETAVIPELMANNFKFFPIESISAETSTDNGNTWTETTLTTAQKQNLVCGNPDKYADINIACTNQFRLIFAANDTVGYVFLDMLYIYLSTANQFLKLKIEGQPNGSTTWDTLSSPSNKVANYPGHCTLWHRSIKFWVGPDVNRHCKVRVTFIPVKNGTNTNNLRLYGLRWHGSYPGKRTEIYNWEYDKSVTFPATLSAQSIDATKLSGTIPSTCYIDTVYTHPASHPISMITGLQTELDEKIKYGDALLTTNCFGGKQLYISKIDNALYRATSRWTITKTIYNADGTVYSTQNDAYKLFDGSYESDGVICPAGKKMVIHFNFNGNFPGYPYGYIFLSFYHTSIPESVTGRMYCNYEPHGIGWHDINFDVFSGRINACIFRGRQNWYKMSELEISYVAAATGHFNATQIEMQLDRSDSKLTPFLSKYGAETLYSPLTAPEFVGKLTGNAATATNATYVINNPTSSNVDYSCIFTDKSTVKEGITCRTAGLYTYNPYTNMLKVGVVKADLVGKVNGCTVAADVPVDLQTQLNAKLNTANLQTQLESLLTLNSAGQIIAIAGHPIYGAPELVWQSFKLSGLIEIDGGGTKTYTLMGNGEDYQSGSYIICSVQHSGMLYGCPVSGVNGAKWVVLFGTSSKSVVYTGRTGTHCYDCTKWYESDAGNAVTATITKIS